MFNGAANFLTTTVMLGRRRIMTMLDAIVFHYTSQQFVVLHD